jgi:hypothetical protein
MENIFLEPLRTMRLVDAKKIETHYIGKPGNQAVMGQVVIGL